MKITVPTSVPVAGVHGVVEGDLGGGGGALQLQLLGPAVRRVRHLRPARVNQHVVIIIISAGIKSSVQRIGSCTIAQLGQSPVTEAQQYNWLARRVGCLEAAGVAAEVHAAAAGQLPLPRPGHRRREQRPGISRVRTPAEGTLRGMSPYPTQEHVIITLAVTRTLFTNAFHPKVVVIL